MGRVTAFVIAIAIAGFTLVFRSSDHAPPHFHVRKGHLWEIRVYIDASTEAAGLSYDYKFPKNMSKAFRGISAGEEKELLKNVILHREALLLEWEQKVNRSGVI